MSVLVRGVDEARGLVEERDLVDRLNLPSPHHQALRVDDMDGFGRPLGRHHLAQRPGGLAPGCLPGLRAGGSAAGVARAPEPVP